MRPASGNTGAGLRSRGGVSINDEVADAVAGVMADFPEAVASCVVTLKGGQQVTLNALRQSLSRGAVAADGQVYADASCQLHVFPVSGLSVGAMQGARVLFGEESMRILSARELPGAAIWALTCGAKGEAT